MKQDTTPTSGNLGSFFLLRGKPEPGKCPECAVAHEPDSPHDQNSLFWQYSFMEKHGHWPTWADAMSHCTLELKARWIQELAKYGIIVEPESNP